jgi:post-segregation antitoxin (ccd killing protein)
MGKIELRIKLDAGLLSRAEAAGRDVAALADAALRKAVPSKNASERSRQWAEANTDAIRVHEQRIERYGVFGDGLPTW